MATRITDRDFSGVKGLQRLMQTTGKAISRNKAFVITDLSRVLDFLWRRK